MASRSKGTDPKVEKFVGAVADDFAGKLLEAWPELMEALTASTSDSASFSCTLQIKRHKATKRKSEYVEAELAPRVRAPRASTFYAIDLDEQGAFDFEAKAGPGTDDPADD